MHQYNTDYNVTEKIFYPKNFFKKQILKQVGTSNNEFVNKISQNILITLTNGFGLNCAHTNASHPNIVPLNCHGHSANANTKQIG